MAAAAPRTAELADDDLAAAIAASHEQVGTDGTLDDIAPGTTHSVPAEEIISDTGVRFGAPWWPFLIYLGAWFALAAVAVWQFQQLAPGTVLYETQQYMMFVFGGLVLGRGGPDSDTGRVARRPREPQASPSWTVHLGVHQGRCVHPHRHAWCGGRRSWRWTTCASAA